ncbi:hypothetical protein IWX90DRAFT_310392 [Phyllosticta citrichinensis]|uniref:Uncharacterized protein n=1 Tax=Phyllosticta citrichinensis TaxID=1130410 RepID=A0ABR1XLS4_9PEZI
MLEALADEITKVAWEIHWPETVDFKAFDCIALDKLDFSLRPGSTSMPGPNNLSWRRGWIDRAVAHQHRRSRSCYSLPHACIQGAVIYCHRLATIPHRRHQHLARRETAGAPVGVSSASLGLRKCLEDRHSLREGRLQAADLGGDLPACQHSNRPASATRGREVRTSRRSGNFLAEKRMLLEGARIKRRTMCRELGSPVYRSRRPDDPHLLLRTGGRFDGRGVHTGGTPGQMCS